jgi:integrase
MLRTVVGGRRCDIGLGSVTLVTLAEARDQAHALRKIARAGGDPLAVRRSERRVVPTFAEAAKQVHAEQSPSFRNEKHKKQWISSLQGVIKQFGTKRLNNVASADVVEALLPEWLSKPETSRRVYQRTHLIFEWAKAQGYCTGNNPTDGVKKVLPKQDSAKTHHAALPYGEVPRFIKRLAKSSSGLLIRLAVELLVLTALRTGEVRLAHWEEIDFKNKTWTIPASRMKTRTEHRVPLTPRMLTILREVHAISGGGDFIFPGEKPGRPFSDMTLLMAVRRLGYEVTNHGFRSSFRDWASERSNFPHAVVEAALAHKISNKVEAAYHRSDLFDRRRRLMNAWGACVLRHGKT